MKKKKEVAKKPMASKSDNTLLAALSYPIPIIGIIVFLTQKDDLTAKFHGLQAVLFWIAAWVITMVVGIVTLGIGFLLWPLFFLYSLFVAYKTYQGEKVVIPIVGPLAEQHSK